MEQSLRRFAAKVLAAHVAVFVLLIVAVAVLVYISYHNVRTQIEELVGQRQQLIARQTARGIEAVYSAVWENLLLLRRSEIDDIFKDLAEENAQRLPPDLQRRQPIRRIIQERLPDGRQLNVVFSDVVWRQLQNRITHLFTIDLQTRRMIDRKRDDAIDAERILDVCEPFLQMVRAGTADGAISPRFDVDGFAFTVVAMRVSSTAPVMHVAVVPIDPLAADFVDPVNRSGADVGAMLFDSDSVCVYAAVPQLIGRNFSGEDVNPAFRKLVEGFRNNATAGFVSSTEPTQMGPVRLERAIVALEPIRMPDGRFWRVSVAAGTSEVNAAVNRLFRNVLIGLPLIVLALSGVMVSTAVSMIRSRSRVEKLRHEAIEAELTHARQIQLTWLPRTPPQLDSITLAAMNKPASHISGDFYNWFMLPDGRLAIVVGDVSGHGLPAAFLMSTTQLLVRSALLRTADPGATLEEVNNELCQQAFGGQFVTLILLVIDPATGRIRYANAGHPPPLIDAGVGFAPLEIDSQLILGVDDHVGYETHTLELPERYSMLIYTDGMIECVNDRDDRYCMEQLAAALDPKMTSADDLLLAAIGAVDQFRNGRALPDDATAVAMRFESPNHAATSSKTTESVVAP